MKISQNGEDQEFTIKRLPTINGTLYQPSTSSPDTMFCIPLPEISLLGYLGCFMGGGALLLIMCLCRYRLYKKYKQNSQKKYENGLGAPDLQYRVERKIEGALEAGIFSDLPLDPAIPGMGPFTTKEKETVGIEMEPGTNNGITGIGDSVDETVTPLDPTKTETLLENTENLPERTSLGDGWAWQPLPLVTNVVSRLSRKVERPNTPQRKGPIYQEVDGTEKGGDSPSRARSPPKFITEAMQAGSVAPCTEGPLNSRIRYTKN